MSKAFLLALTENVVFLWRLILSIPAASPLYFVIRLVLFPLIWAALFLLTLTHFFFFLLDEILFPSYRNVKVSKPLFIVGIPRSGTTWLQRVLANDQSLSTLTLTEALLAPSITQRYVVSGLGYLLKPFGKLLGKIRFQPLQRFDAIHKIRLSEPEEDFLLLLPLHACFLLTILCPKQSRYWKLAKFDEAEKSSTKKIVLNFYKLCVKKHLYFHGTDLQLLSKNPSFTPFISSLRETFNDAHIIACTRPPTETVPSQLGSLAPSQAIFGVGMNQKQFSDKMMEALLGYYKILSTHSSASSRIDKQETGLHIVEMEDLQADLEGIVKKLYSSFDMVLNPDFAVKIKALSSKGKTYKSQHNYDLNAFGLTIEEIRSMFSPYWPVEPRPS